MISHMRGIVLKSVCLTYFRQTREKVELLFSLFLSLFRKFCGIHVVDDDKPMKFQRLFPLMLFREIMKKRLHFSYIIQVPEFTVSIGLFGVYSPIKFRMICLESKQCPGRGIAEIVPIRMKLSSGFP